ncbi:MAG TPA: hypothetical protein PLI43_02465 [Albidovulum sp.]|nr:hypothetical protein [Albidovulum sp.]
MDENGLYIVTGVIIGVVTFVGSWVYAVSEWGFLLGVGLGWIPSLFIGIIAGFVGPPVLALGLVVLLAMFVFQIR